MDETRGLIAVFFITLLSLSCSNKKNDSYTIKDFSNSVQPYLKEVVSKGIVGYDSAIRFIDEHASDEEIKKLSRSEHPVLRATAFREMLRRKSFNHFKVIMDNLDDTAIVATDAGEWGIRFFKISDYILENGRWKDTIAKNKAVDEVILNHNHLRSAYSGLPGHPLEEILYHSIKGMVQRKIDCDNDDETLTALSAGVDFEQLENALYYLAKFRKREDTELIKTIILSKAQRMGRLSFHLMRDFPDETYLEIFEKYYPRRFYRRICLDRSIDNAEDFISSLAPYKNERSKKILEMILDKNPFVPCAADTNTLRRTLVYAIWNNPCEAYSKLKSKIEGLVKDYEARKIEGQIEVEPIPLAVSPDTSAEPVRW